MDYLSDEEIKRAKMCVANIQDKMMSVTTEVNISPKAYKYYLLDKLESVSHDINVLINMCKGE